jgi:hypothetical protein
VGLWLEAPPGVAWRGANLVINVARKWQTRYKFYKRPPFNHPIYKDAVMEELF